MNKVIAAKIEASNISLLDRNGNRIGYAGSPGMAAGEHWVGAVVNGNILTGSTSRGAVVIWELREGSTPVIVGRH
ncbi:MAG: hypothetical protein RIS76_3306 [Verrucomicrobiota bacterium]|jgi:hypothetical protein